MAKQLKFIQFGIGPIGETVAKYLLQRKNVSLEGAIDIDPEKIGRDVGDLIGLGKSCGVKVSGDAEGTLKGCEAKVVVLTTVSSLARLEEQILLCIRYGKNVLCSSEELAFPWIENPALAQKIDREARAAGVTVLGSGVNPGFAMDALPIFLTGICRQVDSLKIERHQDASLRRLPFQQKIGAGLSMSAFGQKAAASKIGHLGFPESLQMIAHSLGWQIERTENIIEPVVARCDVKSQYLHVAKGEVAGIQQIGRAFMGGRAVITLDLQAYLGHPAPRDSVLIEGEQTLFSEIKGGINGDAATAAILANGVPKVLEAAPGLKTMPEIGLVSWFQGFPSPRGGGFGDS